MSDTTKIEWADMTFNPWIGCTKVSPGCAHCYAEQTTRARVLRGQGHETWGKGAKRSRTSAGTWRGPVKWNAECRMRNAEGGQRPRVFPSLCDWLDDEVPIEWLADFLRLIYDTPHLDWLLLTKRPENWSDRLHAALRVTRAFDLASETWLSGWLDGAAPRNVWPGISVEDQKRADERIPELHKIPARVRFLSVEPMLEGIRLNLESRIQNPESGPLPGDGIAWVIFGGESGPKARPCNVGWIRAGVRQCQAARVACFVKQLGSKTICGADEEDVRQFPEWREIVHQIDGYCDVRLNHTKGGDMAEWPEDLRVRQFPGVNT